MTCCGKKKVPIKMYSENAMYVKYIGKGAFSFRAPSGRQYSFGRGKEVSSVNPGDYDFILELTKPNSRVFLFEPYNVEFEEPVMKPEILKAVEEEVPELVEVKAKRTSRRKQ